MLAFWVVEKLDVVKHVLPGLCTVSVCPAPDPFPLEGLEQAFRDCIVSSLRSVSFANMTVPPTAHAGFQIVGLQELLPLMGLAIAIDTAVFKPGLFDQSGQPSVITIGRASAAVELCLILKN